MAKAVARARLRAESPPRRPNDRRRRTVRRLIEEAMRRAILFTLVSFALSSTVHARGQFIALQTPSLQVTKVSANGRFVAGSSAGVGYRIITSTNAEQALPGLDVALGINNFGTIAGAVPVNGGAANGGTDLGAYAPLGADPILLTDALQQDSNGYDISDDGTVVGLSFDDGFVGPAVAFKWTSKEGMVALPVNRPANYSRGNAISSDGSVIAGWNDQDDGYRSAVIWQDGVPFDLTDPDGNPVGEADGVSPNGEFVVGSGYFDPVTFANTAWIWSAKTGIQHIPSMSYAFGVTNDGKTVVGSTGFFDDPPRAAVIWRDGIGTMTSADFLAEQNIAVPAGWDASLSGGFGGISADGRIMAGWSFGPLGIQSYVVKLWCSAPSLGTGFSCPPGTVAPLAPIARTK
jgi:probable HAF family extracellular repeat protein